MDATPQLLGLGSGETQPPLHNEHYDFPDDLIHQGSVLWTHIAREALRA